MFNILRKHKTDRRETHNTASEAEVVRAADRALRSYAKTFKDLARYDRGELQKDSVSH